MATKQTITLVDDLTGKDIPHGNAESVTFALDGVTYEIDLTTENATKLRDALAPFTSKARRIGRAGKSTRPGTSGAGAGVDPAAVRAWAASNGVEVSPRGRIAKDVVRQFLDAQAAPAHRPATVPATAPAASFSEPVDAKPAAKKTTAKKVAESAPTK